MDATNVIVVPVIIAIMQAIKIRDKQDKLKKAYGVIALLLSVLFGFGYAYLVQAATMDGAFMAAALTYSAVQALWAAKAATGVRLNGDTPKTGL